MSDSCKENILYFEAVSRCLAAWNRTFMTKCLAVRKFSRILMENIIRTYLTFDICLELQSNSEKHFPTLSTKNFDQLSRTVSKDEFPST